MDRPAAASRAIGNVRGRAGPGSLWPRMGRLVGAGTTVLLALALSLPAAAAPAAPAKPPSKKEMEAAQKKANQAAARLSTARAALAKGEREIAQLGAKKAETEQVVSALEGQVRELAVAQYVQGGRQTTWVGDGDPGQAARGQAMLRFISLGRTDSVDGYRVARSDLEDSQTALGERRGRQRQVVANLRKEEAKVSGELRRLAAAQKAYEARLAAQRTAAQRARGQRASRNAVTGVIASGEWICPVQGPRAFSNDYGDPRSGGRSHQGNDIMAPRGTPVVASVAGTVKGHNSSLGGISYYLNGVDGNTYFGTHLDRLSGASGRVAAGTVVGYVGSTGNASASVPHLHFEIHPGGGRAVNPFATLSKYC
ncbi:MAG: murein hydrolase activator EnvC family protein [Acidimicrobiales bacterium]